MADQTHDAQSALSRVPVEITISVGRAHPTVAELLAMRRDAILPLDRGVNDPVELYAGDRLIARGELQEVPGDPTGRLAVRLTEVAETDASA
ncbi:FliM/FliN family flagellar motor switch protein [Jannaschia rubra]|uniref:Flagellar motor switch protein n=1 Tax=Jannaschia rubra TaxID=282197 RepID=A0A0M6XQ20_9RHOB|nr:FliM/FliN family flagellar motor switch protein [Jannaschia rubra]CTQ33250.1 flagellar motor switch protein [Jannaschia rubra]SFF97815.1 flagellar motor switch protein FliN/FliY [Jannaschia rubra]